MNKAEFINKVKTTHKEYETALEELSASQMSQPRTCGEWSVKDVIAHVAWHERQMVGVISTRTLGGSPWWNLSLEERNAAIHVENKDRPMEETLKEARVVFDELITQLESLSEEDLHTAGNFKDMPIDWKPWEVIASNTFEHYPDHARDIRAAFPKISK
jgi:uncharacterized protein (TIGR03083 family)